MRSKGKDGGVVVQAVRRWRQGQRGGSFGYALLSPPLPGRSGRVRCSLLLRRRPSFALSRLTGFFDLAGHLGYEFEDSVFGVVRLDRGGFAVS